FATMISLYVRNTQGQLKCDIKESHVLELLDSNNRRNYEEVCGITLALTGHFVSDWLENKIPVDSQQTSDSASSSQTINTSQ
ncbi:63_t:CDS:2, partial [Funneliformis mosseae]